MAINEFPIPTRIVNLNALDQSVADAATSAAASEAARDAAAASATAAALDATATAADRVATNQDRVQTGLDATSAAASAVLADARADDAASFAGYRDYQDVATLLANTSLTYSAGSLQVAAGDVICTRAEGFSYEVAASAATDEHVTTAGGVKLYVLPVGGTNYAGEAFGAAGDDGTDNTAIIQKAIDVSQDADLPLVFGAGIFRTGALTYNGDKPLDLRGSGCAGFPGGVLSGDGTIFKLMTVSARLFANSGGGNIAKKFFRDFSISNGSGGSAETGFYSENGTFVVFDRITGSGFQYGIRHQRTVYSELNGVQLRNCTNGFDFTNITATTPPYVLNDLGASGYFNNSVSFRNCHAFTGTVGFAVAGVTVEFEACDASFCTTGFLFGGANYPLTMVSAKQLYGEGSTGTFIDCTNVDLDVAGVFLGSNYSVGINATSSRVWVGMLRSYAFVVTGVSSSDSFVTVENYGGSFTTKFSQSGTGKVRLLSDEDCNQTTLSVANGSSQDVTLESQTTRSYAVDLLIFENGTSRWALTVIVRGGECYSPHSKPTNLAFSSVLNGNGNYDLRISNTAGFVYSFTGYAKPRPLHYTTALATTV